MLIQRLFYIVVQRIYTFFNSFKEKQGKVYMFHKIEKSDDVYSIDPDSFLEFVKYLKNNKNITDVQHLINNPSKENVVLTFDDVYESVYTNAYPILKELDIPFYVFICIEFVNAPNYLSSSMIKEMISDSKCIIGSHSKTHSISRTMEDKEFEDNIIESKNVLEKYNISCDSFAFPYGSIFAVSSKNIDIAKKHYKYVFSTISLSYNKLLKTIPRINISSKNVRKEIQ